MFATRAVAEQKLAQRSLAAAHKPAWQPPAVSVSPFSLLQQKGQCACGGGCPSCSETATPSIQTKLTISAPGDPFEQEADRVAEQIMSLPSTYNSETPVTISPARLVGRKCSSCEQEPDLSLQEEEPKSIQRSSTNAHEQSGPVGEEEEEEEEEGLLQTKRDYNRPAPFQNSLLRVPGGGHALPETERAFFEARLGHDFQHVRIHSDEKAAHAAHEISAEAFTYGRDIFFGSSQYQPNDPGSRKLLAHELVHTIQQGASPPLSAAEFSHGVAPEVSEKSPAAIHRRVSPDMARIRRNLTGLITTDAEASEVLDFLSRLNTTDLRDTVAVMEREGLVNELFDNVSDDDRANRTVLLQRIQNVRVFQTPTGPVVGSCSPTQINDTNGRVNDTKDWARRSADAINGFILGLGDQTAIGALLDRHFFRQQRHGQLTLERQKNYAEAMVQKLNPIETQNNPYANVCSSPFDTGCRALAGAYTDHTARIVMFCPYYFTRDPQTQTMFLFHELAHAYAHLDDRGYSHERVFDYLTPTDAINNADSYAMFALDIVAGRNASTSHMRTTADAISDCGSPESPRSTELRRSFAYGARLITNALNAISDPGYSTALAVQHFKTGTQSELTRVVDRYMELDRTVSRSINFECESSCDPGVPGYYYRGGRTVHVCPAYFSISSEDERVEKLLLVTTMEELGLPHSLNRAAAAYSNQTRDEAYDNPDAYVAYARDVTNAVSGFRPARAEFRYGRDIRDDFEYESIRLLEDISETDGFRGQIRTRYVDVLRQDLEQELTAHPPRNSTEADTLRQTFITRLTELMAIARRISATYSPLAVDADIRSLITDARFRVSYEHITRELKEKLRTDLLALLNPLAADIRLGVHRIMNQWPALDVLVAQFNRAMQVANSYLPIHTRSEEVFDEFNIFVTFFAASQPVGKRSRIENQGFQEAIDLSTETISLRVQIVNRIQAGTPFAPRSGLADPDLLLHQHQQNLRRFARTLR